MKTPVNLLFNQALADAAQYSAPCSGTVVPVEHAASPWVAQGIFGAAVIVQSQSNQLLAPCAGILSHLDFANLRFIVQASNGLQLLVEVLKTHSAADVVDLTPMHAKWLATLKSTVYAGQPILQYDPRQFQQANHHTQIAVGIINATAALQVAVPNVKVTAGQDPLFQIKKLA